MLQQIADLHIHSKYSRACSPLLELPNIARACSEKGIDIVSTGDFTHPAWFKHLEENLEEVNAGVYQLKSNSLPVGRPRVRFVLGTETACIYKHKGKVRRLHLLLYAPSLQSAAKLNTALDKHGVNRSSDGRPIFGMSAKELLEMMLNIDERMLMVPAHAWTPWFAVFGSKSGYDSLEECFEELTPRVKAIETGLSSDPTMNHRLTNLDGVTLISNSDAHSLGNLGREANVFQFENETEITYSEIRRVIAEGDRRKFLYTIEFYPEEGMYHYDGHRACGVSLSPAETKRERGQCSQCRRPLTIGVLHRVEELADRREREIPARNFIPHKYVVPLKEIIAASFVVGKFSKKVDREYQTLLKKLGSEFDILLKTEISAIEQVASNPDLAVGIQNMRQGKIKISPGYDGVYGTVDVFFSGQRNALAQSRLL